jgi:hypothetical protein
MRVNKHIEAGRGDTEHGSLAKDHNVEAAPHYWLLLKEAAKCD